MAGVLRTSAGLRKSSVVEAVDEVTRGAVVDADVLLIGARKLCLRWHASTEL